MNNVPVILLSGNYGNKKEFARELLKQDNSYRIIDDKDFSRDEKDGQTLDKIIARQQMRKIPAVIYANHSLKDKTKNKNVIYINFKESENCYTATISTDGVTAGAEVKDIESFTKYVLDLTNVLSNELEEDKENM